MKVFELYIPAEKFSGGVHGAACSALAQVKHLVATRGPRSLLIRTVTVKDVQHDAFDRA